MHTHPKAAVTLKPFHPKYQSSVKNLILEGLREHWGSLDLEKNSDLNDISLSFKDADFITAWHNGKLVGTGALFPISRKSAQIVRMSVLKKFRRQGIGYQILNFLVDLASSKGYEELVLETTETWEDAISFYSSYGFNPTHVENGDIYFIFKLKD
jgi:GNAT superfamily N-acetyltransferase